MKNRSCEEMMRSMQSHQDEEEDEDEELDPMTTDGSSQKGSESSNYFSATICRLVFV